MSDGLSRLAGLAVLILAAAFLWAGVVAPLAEWRQEKLVGAEAVQAEKAKLEASISKLKAERAAFGDASSDGLVWIADQQGEAFARVQARLTEAAREAGIRFRAMTPIQSGRGTSDRAVVRVEFEADLAQLTRFLRSVEYARPALPVDRAALRRLVRPNEQSEHPVLFTQIDIAAPLLIGEGS